MSHLLQGSSGYTPPAVITDYLLSGKSGPITLTDFSISSGLWLPVENGAGGLSTAILGTGVMRISTVAAESHAGNNDNYLSGRRSRFRIFPDANGSLIYRFKIENTSVDGFTEGSGELLAGMWLSGMTNTAMIAGIGIGWTGSQGNKLFRPAMGRLTGIGQNGYMPQLAFDYMAAGFDTAYNPMYEVKVNPTLGGDPLNLRVQSSESGRIQWRVGGAGVWTDSTDVGDSHFMGPTIFDPSYVFLGVMMNHVHPCSFDITEFSVDAGILAIV